MTAGELIEKLNKVPKNAEIFLDYIWEDPEWGGYHQFEEERDINSVYLWKSDNGGEVHLSTYEQVTCFETI